MRAWCSTTHSQLLCVVFPPALRQQRDGLRTKLEAIELTSAIVPKSFVADFQRQAEMRAAAEGEAAALRAQLSASPDQQLTHLAQLQHERALLGGRVAELERQLADASRGRGEVERVVEELLAERRLTSSLQARIATGAKERELLLLRLTVGMGAPVEGGWTFCAMQLATSCSLDVHSVVVTCACGYIFMGSHRARCTVQCLQQLFCI